MTNLWSANSPARFWLCQDEIAEDDWRMAIRSALPTLGLTREPIDVDDLLTLVLGEGQFGPDHWQLSPARRLYYVLKPLLPSQLRYILRRLRIPAAQTRFPLGWPVEERYALFQWEVMRQLLLARNQASLTFRHFWPEGRQYAFALTHDVETEEGQAFVKGVADLDESHGFRSSFNFVPERYPLDHGLMQELRDRGFEIGVHGLKHDGKLFSSHAEFVRRTERINSYLRDLDAVGFRSPLTMRNPEWMQALEIEYDLSFFDTDPYEPIPGGTMSIWPFMLGRFVELPYTLVQDCTLTTILGETSPQLWLDKLDFIERYHGMALVNTHPDYLKDGTTWQVYGDLLRSVKERGDYWHALPKDVARWWRARLQHTTGASPPGLRWGRLELNGETVSVRVDATGTGRASTDHDQRSHV
jgi:peptidoglycan/xylan/chitin deacetylase (PgdA/CDA1 family)